MAGRESPLTPAASWCGRSAAGVLRSHASLLVSNSSSSVLISHCRAPGASGPGGRSTSAGDAGFEVQRSKSSTLTRLSRTVSKLGGGKSARARQQAESAANEPAFPSFPQRRGLPPSAGAGGSVGGGRLAATADAGAAGASLGTPSGAGSSLAARLRQFEEGRFDLQADLGSLTEKGVESLRADLAHLDGEVSAQLKAAVAAQYGEFTRATSGILQLEGEFQQLRNQLHAMEGVVAGLKTISADLHSHPGSVSSHRRGLSGSGGHGGLLAAASQAAAEAAWQSGGDGAKWVECLDDADIAVSEQRLGDALSLLHRLDKLLSRFVGGADRNDPAQQARLDSLTSELEQRRERVIGIAEQKVLQPIASSADIRSAADLLSKVAGRQHAHAVVLEAYSAKLKRRFAALLRPANSGGGDADGSDYAAALGQRLTLGLAAAAEDVAAVFGAVGSDAELGAAFLVWAVHQTERACHLLRKHALLPFAAPAGLHAFGRCAFAFLAHCAALEASLGLQLVPTVHRELWQIQEQVLARRVRKLGEALRRAALSEVEALASGAAPLPDDPASWGCLVAAFPSAGYLLDELEAVAGGAVRLRSPRLGAALRKAVGDLFGLYTTSLAAALNTHMRAPAADAAARDRLAAATECAMELSTLLMERCLPEALAPVAAIYGDMCSATGLAEQLLRMGEALGMSVVPLTPGEGSTPALSEAGEAALPQGLPAGPRRSSEGTGSGAGTAGRSAATTEQEE